MINTEEDIQEYTELPNSVRFRFLKPSVRMAKLQYMIPMIGAEGLAELETFGPPSSNTPEGIAVDLCREAWANFTYHNFIPQMSVVVDAVGSHEPENNEFKPTRQWAQRDKLTQVLKRAYLAIDALLLHMDSNIASFPLYAASKTYLSARLLFVSTAQQFNFYYDISSSRSLFIQMLPSLRRLEQFQLIPILGETLKNTIKSEMVTDTLAPLNRQLLENYIRPALVHLAMAEALLNKSIHLTTEGVSVFEVVSPTNSIDKISTAPADLLSKNIQQRKAMGESYIAAMKKQLDSGLYAPAYDNSNKYKSPPTNTTGKGGFVGI